MRPRRWRCHSNTNRNTGCLGLNRTESWSRWNHARFLWECQLVRHETKALTLPQQYQSEHRVSKLEPNRILESLQSYGFLYERVNSYEMRHLRWRCGFRFKGKILIRSCLKDDTKTRHFVEMHQEVSNVIPESIASAHTWQTTSSHDHAITKWRVPKARVKKIWAF